MKLESPDQVGLVEVSLGKAPNHKTDPPIEEPR